MFSPRDELKDPFSSRAHVGVVFLAMYGGCYSGDVRTGSKKLLERGGAWWVGLPDILPAVEETIKAQSHEKMRVDVRGPVSNRSCRSALDSRNFSICRKAAPRRLDV